MNYGFLIDNDRCIGCHACSTACKSENDVPLGVQRTWVKSIETGLFPDVVRHFQVTRCNHCANPPCVRICPVTAMYQRDDGIVEFDGRECIGCKACMQACPYDAVYIDPATGTAAKCHYCAHRVDLGREPSCVVVCPEHAIIAGDMDDPNSEIAVRLKADKVTVRRAELGTAPKLFYKGGLGPEMDDVAASPAADAFAWVDSVQESVTVSHSRPGVPKSNAPAVESPTPARVAGQMAQVVFNAQHRIPWHWQVPAYLLTKGIGSGLFLIAAVGVLAGIFEMSSMAAVATGGTALIFIALTTVLLVLDLEKPERFLRILVRPQWRSWLTRGAFILIVFSLILAGWTMLEFIGLRSGTAVSAPRLWRVLFLGAGIPFAAGAAVYTAFLFHQARGRAHWQQGLLPVHMLVQAILAGAAVFLLMEVAGLQGDRMFEIVRDIFRAVVLIDLALLLAVEFYTREPSNAAKAAQHMITRGRYARIFWFGGILAGHVVPLLYVFSDTGWATAAALALLGLYLYEYVFVMAPQHIPNS